MVKNDISMVIFSTFLMVNLVRQNYGAPKCDGYVGLVSPYEY